MPQQHLIQARLHVLNTSGGVSHFNKILMPVDLHHGIAGDPRALAKKSFLQLLHPRISLFFRKPMQSPWLFATSAFIRGFDFFERDENQ
jgi:hypothetical protein